LVNACRISWLHVSAAHLLFSFFFFSSFTAPIVQSVERLWSNYSAGGGVDKLLEKNMRFIFLCHVKGL